MPFSRLRQHLSGSSRREQEKVAQLKQTFPNEEPERPNQAFGDVKRNHFASSETLDISQTQRSTSSTQLGPRKLQRPDNRQYATAPPDFAFNGGGMHPPHQHAPAFPPNNWNGQPPGPGPPQYQPAFAPVPPHSGYRNQPAFSPSPPHQAYMPPPAHHRRPLLSPYAPTKVLLDLKHWPSAPSPVPPLPSNYHIPEPPWTPNQQMLSSWDVRAGHCVPLYELPPPDLMDYDMGFLISVRMLPEWTRYKEERHWEEVRRVRNEALMGPPRDECTVM